MADKIIKSFTIGADKCKVDYVDGIVNKPTIPADKSAEIAALQAQVAALSPKAVKVSWTDANINSVKRYRYYASSLSYDVDAAAIASGQVLYARDGDFGYIALDEAGIVDKDNLAVVTGQVNLGIKLADGYVLNHTESVENAFKNFKTPYLTCVDDLYRFTKINKSFNTEFSTVKESDLEAYNITYKLSIQQPTEGEQIAAEITTYRCEDAALAKYKGKVLAFVEGSAADYSYSKETGYKDKSEESVGNAQINFRIHTSTLPAGYGIQVTTSAKNYNKLEKNTIDTELWKATKVKGDFEVNIVIRPLEVYNVTYVKGSYEFGKAADGEVPATVVEGTDLVFKFYHQVDKGQPATEPTKAETIAKLDSIKVGENNIELKESYVTTAAGKKKATITVPASKINGAVVVTTKTVE